MIEKQIMGVFLTQKNFLLTQRKFSFSFYDAKNSLE